MRKRPSTQLSTHQSTHLKTQFILINLYCILAYCVRSTAPILIGRSTMPILQHTLSAAIKGHNNTQRHRITRHCGWNKARCIFAVLVVLYSAFSVVANAQPVPTTVPVAAPAAAPTSTPIATTGCTNTLASPINNFCEVTANTLWRGAKPDEQGAAWLITQGVHAIVNLELLHDDLANMSLAKINLAGKNEIDYFRLRDWEPLAVFAPSITDHNVIQFLTIMQQSAKPVYVHCRSGQNRTGVMVAAYKLLIENTDLEKTIDEMKQYHGFWSFADARYLRGLASRRDEILRHVQAKAAKPKRYAHVICEHSQCQIKREDD